MPVVTAITCFVIEYAWPGRWLTRRNVIILFIPSLLILITVMTNDLHHLVWRGFSYDERIVPERTRLDWLIIAYAYALVILDIIILALLFHRSPQYRRPVAIMLAGQIIARGLYILYVTEIFPPGLLLQTPPIAFEYLMYAVALFGFHMFDPISLARQTAVEQIHAGMMVLDPKGTVVSLNPAARAMIKLTEKRILGRPVQGFLPISDQMIQSGRFETSLGAGAETSYFQAETSALDDGRGLEVGRLLLLHEVTEQKKAEARLIEQQRVLATLRERDRLARELHDELAQGLALINLQAQLIRDLLDAGQMEQAKEQLQILAQAARDVHVDVRGEIGELAHGIRSEDDLPGALRRITENFQQVNGIQTELVFLVEGPLSPIAPTVEVQLLRIVQEALANIRKHAQAKHAKVTLRKRSGLPGAYHPG